MKRFVCSVLIFVLLLPAAGCSRNTISKGTTFASRADINLGEDKVSHAAALVIHVMQVTDAYAPRLNSLENIPDTSEMRLATEDMRTENLLFSSFITGFAAAMYNARPITGSGYTASFEQNEYEVEFSVTTTDDVVYEGKLDENAGACYVFRYEGEDMQFCKLIADKNGYYIELMAQAQSGDWFDHRAYYSGNKWFFVRAKLDEQPQPDLVYHYLPYDFEHFAKSLSPQICRAEYYHGEQLTYWDFTNGLELTWLLGGTESIDIDYNK